MSRLHVVAILDTMWGDEPGEAPPFFKINPRNHSGRRLYNLIGEDASLLVTDSCRELVTSPKDHGKPDPEWLRQNLEHLESLRHIDLLLVCGAVAKKTYGRCCFLPSSQTRIIEMPHPAARLVWTRDLIEKLKAEIAASRQPLTANASEGGLP